MHNNTVAVIPGDGVGPEVMAVAAPLMVQAAKSVGASIDTVEFDWGSEHYRHHGRAMPEDAAQRLRQFDGILFGSLGTPGLPDHEVVGSLIQLRKDLDLGANVRPVQTWPGIPTPFHDNVNADLVVVRENTEGEYSGVGGRSRVSGVGDVALAVAVHSESTVTALARFAFALARRRRRRVTLISKANAMHHAFSLWEQIGETVAAEHPDIEYEVCLVDAAAARMVQRPESFDVMLTSNLFGDVLSEIGSTHQGGLGMAASANVPTTSDAPGLFEPIHGSAPDIAGQGVANPTGALLSATLLLDHVGLRDGGDLLRRATRQVVADQGIRTRDLGGRATTDDVGRAVETALVDLAG